MKQVEQNYRSGRLSVVDVPAPAAGSSGALISTRISLISSGTERQIIDLARASLVGKARARPDLVRQVIRKARQEGLISTANKVFARLDAPIPLGYSLAGRVLDSGEDPQAPPVGARVACAGAGSANHAEFNVVPKNLTAVIPDGVSDEDASFVTLGAIALQGVRVAQPSLSERVTVMGLGLIGQLTVQLLKANGCNVIGFDPNPARAALAMELGADKAVSENLRETVAAFTHGQGADAVILTASTKSNEPINLAAEISRMKGRVVVVGQVGMDLERDPFYKRELDLRLSMSYGPGRYDPAYELEGHDYPLPFVRWTEQRNMAAFLDLIAQGRVTPSRLVTHHFSIAEAERAYEVVSGDEPHMAILLSYPDDETRIGLRREPAPSQKRATAQDAALGIGFIGFGNYARSVLHPAVSRSKLAAFKSVATATGLSAMHSAKKYGFVTACTDSRAVLSDPEVDVVFIATRHSSHADLTVKALEAGKSVFCEKPAALTKEDLDKVFAAAHEATGVYTVGFNRRFAPLMLQLKTMLEGRSGPLAMTYRVNAGPTPKDTWLTGPEGGGRLIGECCHFVDALSFLCGATPVEVTAVAPNAGDDSFMATLHFSDGSVASLLYTALGDPSAPKEYLEVFGEGRVGRLDDFRSLTVSRAGRTRRTTLPSQDKGQNGLVSAFFTAAKAGGSAPIPLGDLVASTQATFAIVDALRTGERVMVGASAQDV